MGRYKGINHLAMATSDMDATIRFWRDLLGLRLVGGLGKRGYRLYFFELSENDLIAFFEWPGIEPIPEKDHGVPAKGAFAFDHISLGLKSEEDLWRIKAALEAAGFWVSEVMDHGFILSVYSFDPNGIAIEFSWDVPGEDLRERPLMLDRFPAKAALEGADPQGGNWPEPLPPSAEERQVYPGEGLDFKTAQ